MKTENDVEYLKLLNAVGTVIDGQNIDNIVPVLMTLLCQCAEIQHMTPDKLLVYFIASIANHFGDSNINQESIH